MTPDSPTDEPEVVDEAVDAIALLSADHEDVKQLFADYEELVDQGAGSEQRAGVARQICQALTAHTVVEEEIFYPAVREVLDDPGLIDEAMAEHAQAKALIGRLQAQSASDPGYDDIVQSLQEAIEHHVHEEETGMFPMVRGKRLDLHDLGERLWQRREEVLADLEVDDGPG